MFTLLLFAITINQIIPLMHSIKLTDNVILHLDKNSPNYLDRLQPWNSKVSGRTNFNTLTYVIGVFRHGNRPPADTFKDDKYPYFNKTYWPNGPSRLTKVGAHHLCLVGKKLRERYDGFLSPIYKPEEFLIKANAVERVVSSAGNLTFGLYGNTTSEEEWHPIPIAEQWLDMEKVAHDPAVCARFDNIRLQLENLVNGYNYQYQEFMEYLNNCTDLNITNLYDLFIYWNAIYFEEHEGYERPYWADEKVVTELANIAQSSFLSLFMDQEMLRLITGPLIEEFALELREKTSGREGKMKKRKMHLEGGHGTTLNAVLPALGFKEPFIAEVGAVFLLELHSSHIGYYVQMVYLPPPDVNEETQILEIPECGYQCPLEQMLNNMERLYISNWEKECERSRAATDLDISIMVLILSLTVSFY